MTKTQLLLTWRWKFDAKTLSRFARLSLVVKFKIDMGAYTIVRGWIQIEESMRDSVKRIIENHIEKHDEFSIDLKIAEFYNNGWHIQLDSINGALFAFYGAEIRTHSIDFIKTQVESIASLKERTEDCTLFPEGYFHLDEDGTHSLPPEEWIVADGKLISKERRGI